MHDVDGRNRKYWVRNANVPVVNISVKEETSRELLSRAMDVGALYLGIDAELQAELQSAALPAGSW